MSSASISSIIIAQNIKQIVANIKIPKYPPLNDFPSDVLKYMKKNANPKEALKLMKLNKYFIQEKCPFTYVGNNTFVSENGGIRTSNYTNEMIYKLPNNLGINGILRVHEDSTDIDIHIRLLFDKIIVFDLKCLILHVKKFKYDHFKTLISSGNLKELALHDTILTSKNDEIIPYETLLDDLPSLCTLVIDYNPATIRSQKFIEKICSSNLKVLWICYLTESFNFEKFLTVIKNRNTKLDVHLFFQESNLKRILCFRRFVVYRNVKAYIDKLVKAGVTDSCPPFFHLHDCDVDKKRIYALKKLRETYFQCQN